VAWLQWMPEKKGKPESTKAKGGSQLGKKILGGGQGLITGDHVRRLCREALDRENEVTQGLLGGANSERYSSRGAPDREKKKKNSREGYKLTRTVL